MIKKIYGYLMFSLLLTHGSVNAQSVNDNNGFYPSKENASAIVVGGINTIYYELPQLLGKRKKYVSLETEFNIQRENRTHGFFWANQFKLIRGKQKKNAYMGLIKDATTGQKMAIFSIWGTNTAKASHPRTRVKRFTNEGRGYSVRFPFNWRANRNYRLKAKVIGKWVHFYLKQKSQKRFTNVGRIKMPQSGFEIDRRIIGFTELFRPRVTSCQEVPNTRMKMGKFIGNDNQYAKLISHLNYGNCAMTGRISSGEHHSIMLTR